MNKLDDLIKARKKAKMKELPKRSDCNCSCHEGLIMHMTPCCRPDDERDERIKELESQLKTWIKISGEMSGLEEDEPRFQGSDDDKFVSAMPDIIYDQTMGEQMARRIKELESQLSTIQAAVNEQAEDEGLWFDAETAPEDVVQRALRRLHSVIETPSNPNG